MFLILLSVVMVPIYVEELSQFFNAQIHGKKLSLEVDRSYLYYRVYV